MTRLASGVTLAIVVLGLACLAWALVIFLAIHGDRIP